MTSFWQKAGKKIFCRITSEKPGDFFGFLVQCEKCGEEIEVRARKSTDLMANYDEEIPSHYVLKKEILGTCCTNLLYANLSLDGNLRVVNAEVRGGHLL
ncbi:hypothetical protein HKBW3S43_02015 [Candidatus Hakubella thermalkaliphila]|uniref:Uncharacterized protein n=1 Tax=Candidatus Hakubella thermalkaliphila TaxID=2754717 RepID=A0A6V8PVD0_9ACTN|nr:hypothetical protein [Candidatus Hakubella thermalkaliphila]GFP36227.1 hypothetical protein HKBW3S43_02015 [Candidatus Hakubella thermalkaliphila]